MLFSLAHTHKHKQKRISISISARKTNMFVFLVLMLMLMLMRECEQHKTNKWVRSSAYAYAYVAGVLTCLCLCYGYALARTSLKDFRVPCPSIISRTVSLNVVSSFHQVEEKLMILFSPPWKAQKPQLLSTSSCKSPDSFRRVLILVHRLFQEAHCTCNTQSCSDAKNNRATRAGRILVQLFWRSMPNNDAKCSHSRF